jgi:nitroreductase
METLESIKNRRSIRKFKPDPVDEATLNKVLDAARLAPSWANTQCVRYIVVRSTETRNALAEAVEAHKALHKNPGANSLRMAPVVIVAVAEKGLSGYFDGIASTEKGEYWYMLDVGIAMENLVLAAADLGLGTVHIGLFDAKRVTELLKIPDNCCVVEMTPLGYPEFQPNPRPRKELGEIVYHEEFGKK